MEKARTALQERMTSFSSDSCFSGGNLCRSADSTGDDMVTHCRDFSRHFAKLTTIRRLLLDNTCSA